MSKEYEPYMFSKRKVDGFVLKWKDSLMRGLEGEIPAKEDSVAGEGPFEL